MKKIIFTFVNEEDYQEFRSEIESGMKESEEQFCILTSETEKEVVYELKDIVEAIDEEVDD